MLWGIRIHNFLPLLKVCLADWEAPPGAEEIARRDHAPMGDLVSELLVPGEAPWRYAYQEEGFDRFELGREIPELEGKRLAKR